MGDSRSTNSQDTLPVPPTPSPVVAGEELPWIKVAMKELGIARWAKGNNPRIVEYLHSVDLPENLANDQWTPWCASFVEWCLDQCSMRGTKNAMARSYLKFGVKLEKPIPGCILIFYRGDRNGEEGHTGFYMGTDAKGNIMVLGGNEGNGVRIARYPAEHLLGCVWPKEAPIVLQSKKAPQADPGTIPTLSWEKSDSSRAAWSSALWALIGQHYDSFAKANDTSFFYPGFDKLDRAGKMRVWAEIICWLCYFESAWDQTCADQDVGTADDKSTWSVGLMQLSAVDCQSYNIPLGYSFDDLKDPIKNLTLGTAILSRQFEGKGKWMIAAGESGLYFATLHPGGKYDKSDSIKAHVQTAIGAS